jgi:putative protease
MSERRPAPSGTPRPRWRRSPQSASRSAIAAFERAAVAHHRQGGPRVEGRRLAVVAVARDEPELLAAVAAGADAVRLVLPLPPPAGGGPDVARLAALVGHGRAHGCRVWAALPEPVPQPDMAAAAGALWALRAAGVEAVEVGDLGLLRLVRDRVPGLAVHAGPTLGARSAAAVEALAAGGARRVVLAPDVRPAEVRAIAAVTAVELEVPLHGPACVAAGRCHLAGAAAAGHGVRGACGELCAAMLAVAPPGDRGVGHDPERAPALVAELRAAGAAAVRVAPGPGADLGRAVHAFRLAAAAGPVLDDETAERVRRLLADREPTPAAPERLAGAPSGLAVHLELEAGADVVRVVVRDERERLGEVSWPAAADGAPTDSLDALEAALCPPTGSGLRAETFVLRGPSGPPPAGALAALWRAVTASLERQRAALLARVGGEPGAQRDSAPLRRAPLVCLGLADLASAATLLGRDVVDRAEVPLSALAGPAAPAGVPPLGPELGASQRARLYVGLPRVSGEGDWPELVRRLRGLGGAGLGGVVVHDLGQAGAAQAAGLAPIAGEGLAVANAEALGFLEELGCRAATLDPARPVADWLALLAVRPTLPLRAPVRGWFAAAATRLAVPPDAPSEEGWWSPDGATLWTRVEDGVTLLVSLSPLDRPGAVDALGDAGVHELLLDLRGAPPGDPHGTPESLLAPLRRGSAPGARSGGLEPTLDRDLEQQLGRLYASADRLTRSFRERHGLTCSSACARCCAQLVPVWPAEAHALIPGVRALVTGEAERAALRARAEAQLAEQRAVFERAGLRRHPSELPIWRVRPGQLEPLVGRAWSACVLLADGRCSVYARRPLLCRVYGFPTAAIPGNLCRRLSAPLLDAATNGRMPSIPATHVHRLGEAIRQLQGLPDGVTDLTTVAAIVAHVLRGPAPTAAADGWEPSPLRPPDT